MRALFEHYSEIEKRMASGNRFSLFVDFKQWSIKTIISEYRTNFFIRSTARTTNESNYSLNFCSNILELLSRLRSHQYIV